MGLFKRKVHAFVEKKDTVDVTIILNIWKRKYLIEQLYSILNQSVLPKEIWIIHYENHYNISRILKRFKKEYPNIIYLNSSHNFKFFGRFSWAINVSTEYTWILDDDIIPGKLWLQRCVENCQELNSIITCSGRMIPKYEFQPEHARNLSSTNFIGDVHYLGTDMTMSKEQKIVDFGCQSYFFKSIWIKAFWSIWPITFLSGEDIHLSATCKVLLGIKTTVLKQIDRSESGSIRKDYGIDQFATFKSKDFLSIREKVIRYHVMENKWKPILWD